MVGVPLWFCFWVFLLNFVHFSFQPKADCISITVGNFVLLLTSLENIKKKLSRRGSLTLVQYMGQYMGMVA